MKNTLMETYKLCCYGCNGIVVIPVGSKVSNPETFACPFCKAVL